MMGDCYHVADIWTSVVTREKHVEYTQTALCIMYNAVS